MSNLINVPKRSGVQRARTNFGTFPSLSTWFDDILGDDLPNRLHSNFNTGITLPAVNIKENTDAYVVEMAVPGFNKNDFDVNVENNVLTISSETEETKETEEDNFTRREFGYSSFKRTFSLPDTVASDKISANYDEGILNVVLPKREEAKQKPSRNIKIS